MAEDRKSNVCVRYSNGVVTEFKNVFCKVFENNLKVYEANVIHILPLQNIMDVAITTI